MKTLKTPSVRRLLYLLLGSVGLFLAEAAGQQGEQDKAAKDKAAPRFGLAKISGDIPESVVKSLELAQRGPPPT